MWRWNRCDKLATVGVLPAFAIAKTPGLLNITLALTHLQRVVQKEIVRHVLYLLDRHLESLPFNDTMSHAIVVALFTNPSSFTCFWRDLWL